MGGLQAPALRRGAFLVKAGGQPSVRNSRFLQHRTRAVSAQVQKNY